VDKLTRHNSSLPVLQPGISPHHLAKDSAIWPWIYAPDNVKRCISALPQASARQAARAMRIKVDREMESDSGGIMYMMVVLYVREDPGSITQCLHRETDQMTASSREGTWIKRLIIKQESH